MLSLTRVQKQILYALMDEQTLQRRGLFQLCLDLSIDYHNAWTAVRQMEIYGLVTVNHQGSRELSLTLGPTQAHTGGQSKLTPRRGTISHDFPHATHNIQGMALMTFYPRPKLTPEEETKYGKIAVKINSIQDQRLRLVYVAAMVAENVSLVKEVNEHRQARGLDPIPVYDPEKGR